MFFNQHSYVISGLFLLILVSALSLREGVTWRAGVALGVVLAVLIGGWLLTRTGPSTYSDAARVEAVLADGQPTFVEFYSNY